MCLQLWSWESALKHPSVLHRRLLCRPGIRITCFTWRIREAPMTLWAYAVIFLKGFACKEPKWRSWNLTIYASFLLIKKCCYCMLDRNEVERISSQPKCYFIPSFPTSALMFREMLFLEVLVSLWPQMRPSSAETLCYTWKAIFTRILKTCWQAFSSLFK